MLRAFFARSPDGARFWFATTCYGAVEPSGLYARLCHAFLVFIYIQKHFVAARKKNSTTAVRLAYLQW